MIVKLLTEHHLEVQSFKGGCKCSSESTLVKMSNCWKSHATAQYRTKVIADSEEPSYQIVLPESLRKKSFFCYTLRVLGMDQMISNISQYHFKNV